VPGAGCRGDGALVPWHPGPGTRRPVWHLAPGTRHPLDDSRFCKMLAKLVAEAGGAIHLAHQLMVGHAGEEVVAARREIALGRPLLALERDVGLLVVLGKALKKRADAVAGGVLGGERDEEEADAEIGDLVEPEWVRLVLPLERRGVVEGEARLREALADLGREGLERTPLGGRELAPEQVG